MHVDYYPSIEIGKKQHRLHSHVIVTCHHNSNLKIDINYLKKALDAPYLEVAYVKSSADLERMLKYLRKDL